MLVFKDPLNAILFGLIVFQNLHLLRVYRLFGLSAIDILLTYIGACQLVEWQIYPSRGLAMYNLIGLSILFHIYLRIDTPLILTISNFMEWLSRVGLVGVYDIVVR